MDREILFRAKRIDKGEWVNGYVTRIKHSDDKGKVESYYFNALDELGWVAECSVSAETVCQYTGLTDKNGRKIFEGDIIKHFNDGLNPMKFKIAVVKWSGEGCVYVQQNSLGMEWRIYGRYSECYEVIGNIYDNPELLGAGNTSGQQGKELLKPAT